MTSIEQRENGVSTIRPLAPVVDQGRERTAIQTSLETVAGSIAALDRELLSIAAKVEAAPDSKTRDHLREKRGALEYRRARLKEEEEFLQRQLASIEQAAQRQRIEDAVRLGLQLQHDGTVLAAELRLGVMALAAQLSAWRSAKEQHRVLKDILRSLAPDRMTELVEFAWITDVPAALESAVDQALAECYKVQKRGAERQGAKT